MENVTVYLKCDRNIEVQTEDVFLKDLGELRCADKLVAAKLKTIKVHKFTAQRRERCVISTLKLIELMEETCPNISVEVIGESDVLLEWVEVNRYKGFKQWVKVVFVCLISFFGTAFTIMAYHNDVDINGVFSEVYEVIMQERPQGINPLQISYSLGLAIGITLFFNHIGGRRITKDPTPIEVAMRNYEEDVDRALIATAGREGLEEET